MTQEKILEYLKAEMEYCQKAVLKISQKRFDEYPYGTMYIGEDYLADMKYVIQLKAQEHKLEELITYIKSYDYDKWSALHINKIIEKGKSMPDKQYLHI